MRNQNQSKQVAQSTDDKWRINKVNKILKKMKFAFSTHIPLDNEWKLKSWSSKFEKFYANFHEINPISPKSNQSTRLWRFRKIALSKIELRKKIHSQVTEHVGVQIKREREREKLDECRKTSRNTSRFG